MCLRKAEDKKHLFGDGRLAIWENVHILISSKHTNLKNRSYVVEKWHFWWNRVFGSKTGQMSRLGKWQYLQFILDICQDNFVVRCGYELQDLFQAHLGKKKKKKGQHKILI